MATKNLGYVKAGIAALTVLLVGGAHVSAQSQVPPRLAGIINDYVESGGAWHISGEWSVQGKAGGKADFIASLNMLRSDLWVLLTGADPTNPALRGVHTHHLGLIDGTVTVIANGFRISGTAIITSNGSVAGFSGSPVDVEITGGGLLPSSNLKLTFTGAATGHFGTQPLDGVVIFGR
jgi:hypothetical protein